MWHVRREKRKPYRGLMGNIEGNKPLRSFRSKWKVSIKQILKKQGGRGWGRLG
jgi:hypothetical protein